MLCRRIASRSFSSSAKSSASSSSTRLYDLLNVSKTSSEDEIKKAYKKAALEHHPDRGGDTDKFKEISNAYSILSDPQKRQVYDQFGEAGLDSAGNNSSGHQHPNGGNFYSGQYQDPMDIFSQVFGGSARRRSSNGGVMRGRDAVYNLELGLDEIANGANRTIAYNRDVACKNCGGKGATKIDTCKRCGGSGVVLTRQNIGFLVHMQTACPDCGGEGYTVPRGGHCSPCNSSGVVSQKESFQVEVCPGTHNGHEFRFAGKADQLPGHSAGDVIVRIRTKPHVTWKRLSGNSSDLVMKHEISLTDALEGFDMKINRVGDKEEIRLVSYPGRVVAPGDVCIASGLGLPRVNGTTRGNLYIKFQVKFPKNVAEMSLKDKERMAKLFSSTSLGNGGGETTSSLSSAASLKECAIVMEPVTVTDTIRRVNEGLDMDGPKADHQSSSKPHEGGYRQPHPPECHQQ